MKKLNWILHAELLSFTEIFIVKRCYTKNWIELNGTCAQISQDFKGAALPVCALTLYYIYSCTAGSKNLRTHWKSGIKKQKQIKIGNKQKVLVF